MSNKKHYLKINEKFANNPIYNEVKKNENYGMFKAADGTLRPHKFVKVNFIKKKTSHKEGSKNVVCTIDCMIKFDIPFYWENSLTECTYFTVVGVAVCSDDDKFDLGKGKLIAQAKAENEAYKVANNMLAALKQQLSNFAKALDNPMAALEEYQSHNDKFIDKVIDGEINPKY